MDKSSKSDGVLEESIIQTELIRHGVEVSVPVSYRCRYDLVADIDGDLYRVQCKKARPVDSVDTYKFSLKTISTNANGHISKPYEDGELDSVAVYIEEEDMTLWIPFDETPRHAMNISVKDKSELLPQNKAKTNLAQDYLLKDRIQALFST